MTSTSVSNLHVLKPIMGFIDIAPRGIAINGINACHLNMLRASGGAAEYLSVQLAH